MQYAAKTATVKRKVVGKGESKLCSSLSAKK